MKLLCLVIATSLLVAACGSGDDNSGSQTAAAPTPTATPANKQPATGSAHAVSLAPKGDQLLFDTNQLSAKAGKVTVNFTNDSAIPHNVTLINSANKTLDGGTKSFNATLKPGTYTYYCSVPGHREAGMQGTLTVK
jgi:plastocyanin